MKKHEGNIGSYRATFLDCRVGMSGHNWKWLTDFKIVRDTQGNIIEFSRARRCTRCRSESIKVYDGQNGTVLRRSYRYSDGYSFDAEHAPRPGGAVLEALRRSLEEGKIEE